MALYEMGSDSFREIKTASFAALKVTERGDLQRLLREQISVVADNLHVLSEEFSEWEDSKRRIDILAIDDQANLVVIELKRTSDGGHMDLQAIRYAAMVSAMTFARAVDIHADYLHRIGKDPANAESEILKFLEWEQPDDELFAADVRILLVAQDFGIEITTSVLWLRDKGLDIGCVRLVPYTDNDRCLVDVQQIIPLPEAVDYMVRLKEKEQQERQQKNGNMHLQQRFWEGVVQIARQRNTRHANTKPAHAHWIGASAGVGHGIRYNYVVYKDKARAELYIDCGDAAKNKAIYDQLAQYRENIERAFPEKLSWQRLDDKRGSRIRATLSTGGYKTPESEWPEIQADLVDMMIRLEAAISPELEKVRF